jgi:hypothetical protein
MSFLKPFKTKAHAAQPKIEQAIATLYPEQILIATVDRTVVGYSITTPEISKLPVDAIFESIGQTVKKHLSLSKTEVPAPSDFNTLYQEFLKAAGFENAKAHYKGARYLSIYQKDNEIVITPTVNGGATGKEGGFLGSKDIPTIHVNASISDNELGAQIRKAWSNCVGKSV